MNKIKFVYKNTLNNVYNMTQCLVNKISIQLMHTVHKYENDQPKSISSSLLLYINSTLVSTNPLLYQHVLSVITELYIK